MPIGLVRLNERRQRPNKNITFIKVGDGPDKEIAEDILERVAAIVWPIMRENHLGVMTLEDFPPNREFWGRNFNAGECIQLVLKSPMTGLWLPFSFVCKVMLHELAHIKQMNHSRAFHAVRIGYHKEFDALTARGYTGEGFWSRGQTVSSDFTAPRHLSEAEMPENLCGGTYRTAKKPEKRKLTYAERQQKRKEKLFGKGEGEVTGGDEKVRASLEKGKSKKAIAVKPRVAQSQRGRDLRLEAALKRQEAAKAEATASGSASKKEESDDEYETEEEEETVDVGGGHRMVKVEEQGQDGNEWDEFRDEIEAMNRMSLASSSKASNGRQASILKSSSRNPSSSLGTSQHSEARPATLRKRKASTDDSAAGSSDEDIVVVSAKALNAPAKKTKAEVSESSDDNDTPPPPSHSVAKSAQVPRTASGPPKATTTSGASRQRTSTSTNQREKAIPAYFGANQESSGDELPPPLPRGTAAAAEPAHGHPPETLITCSTCTMENPPDLALCAICANVLDIDRTPHWLCTSMTCQGTPYSNPRDAGICGCCGNRRGA